mmetsp:Transcript_22013/g.56027  ORF Transcript_22013/g.56027 Transcript_22013/m.56027 type:complete len:234 (-) Transcript_22013:765-1466(-)
MKAAATTDPGGRSRGRAIASGLGLDPPDPQIGAVAAARRAPHLRPRSRHSTRPPATTPPPRATSRPALALTGSPRRLARPGRSCPWHPARWTRWCPASAPPARPLCPCLLCLPSLRCSLRGRQVSGSCHQTPPFRSTCLRWGCSQTCRPSRRDRCWCRSPSPTRVRSSGSSSWWATSRSLGPGTRKRRPRWPGRPATCGPRTCRCGPPPTSSSRCCTTSRRGTPSGSRGPCAR